MSFFDEFMKVEISDHTRRLLLEAFHDGKVDANIKQREFTFNRFNVVIDFENQHVKIDDELTVSEKGQIAIGIAEFIKAIQEGTE